MASAPEAQRSRAARTVFRACPLCEATCGVAVDVDGYGRATAVRGDADDPLGRGYICPKAHGLIGLQEDPDRLRHPVQRIGEEWHEIGWDDAFALVGERLRGLRDSHSPEALGVYLGNPNVHDLGSVI